MQRRVIIACAAVAATGFAWWLWRTPRRLTRAAFAALYAQPLPSPPGPLATYHLGHSLVGRDMPAMLAQLASHPYHSQLGWGASLQDHWQDTVKGFDTENLPPAFAPARKALQSGAYGAVIFTEMVELRDAIRWHNSAERLAGWAHLARKANPAARLYLYETWHPLNDPAGWLARIDADLPDLWEGQILRPAMARPGVGTIHIIPAGQVMAAAARAIEAGLVPGMTSRKDLFSDDIHPNDLGNWLIAMTHIATLYHKSPLGLSAQLTRADGTPATPPGQEAALVLQELVWRVVTGYRATGVAQTPT
jgi:hypothetical protein